MLLDIKVSDAHIHSGVLDTVTQQKDKPATDKDGGVVQGVDINDAESKTHKIYIGLLLHTRHYTQCMDDRIPCIMLCLIKKHIVFFRSQL